MLFKSGLRKMNVAHKSYISTRTLTRTRASSSNKIKDLPIKRNTTCPQCLNLIQTEFQVWFIRPAK